MAMLRNQLFFNLILLAGGCATASAQDYYLSRLGNDLTATGKSAQSPWRTVAKMNQAMGSLRSGDKILFRAGDTFDVDPRVHGLLLDRKSGITIDSYTTTGSTSARATLRVLPGTTYGIQLQRSQGIILQNLEVIGAWNPTLPRSSVGSMTPVSYPDGIYGNWLSNSTIRNVTV